MDITGMITGSGASSGLMNGVLDLAGMIVYSDKECVHFLGGRVDYPLEHLVLDEDREIYNSALDEVGSGAVRKDLVIRMRRADGTVAPFLLSMEPKDEDDERQIAFTIKDILLVIRNYEESLGNGKVSSGVQPVKEQGRRRAYGRTGDLDPATGILNKPSIQNYCKERLSEMKEGQTLWLAIGDIDDFKNVNDSFGHAFGDEVILETAKCLSNEIGEKGAVGRFGGDEFFICVEDADEAEIRKLLTQFRKTLEWNVLQLKSDCHVTMSVGTVSAPLNGQDYDELFAKADKALYIAKGKGKNRYIIYREAMHGDTVIPKDETAIRYAHSYTERVAATIARMTTFFVEKKEGYVRDAMREIMDVFVLDEVSVFEGADRKCVFTSRRDKKDSISEEEIEDIVKSRKISVNGVLVVNRLSGLVDNSPRLYEWLHKKKVTSAIFCLFFDTDRNVRTVYAYQTRSANSRKWGSEDANYLLIYSNMCQEAMFYGEGS